MQVKRCPSCGGEYFATVHECADCGVELVLPEELEQAKIVPGTILDPAAGSVAVREGEKEWIEELAEVLKGTGIPCRLTLAPGCTPGRCGSTYRIVVMEEDAAAALKVIETYYRDTYPELAEAQDGILGGACPACGFMAGADATDCPECGLVLMIREDEPASGAG